MSERSVSWPAAIESSPHDRIANAEMARPLSDGPGFPVYFDKDVGPSVIGLIFSGRPPAIVFRVTARIVDAINCAAVRAWPHVSHELLERFPGRRNGYASAAISGVRRMGGVSASRPHVLPCLLLAWVRGAAKFTPLRPPGCSALFAGKAAARARAAFFQLPCRDSLFAAALTFAAPSGTSGSVIFGAAHNCEEAEAHARQIFEPNVYFRHGIII